MQTVPFSQLFSFDESSQTITPRVAVRIDGATFGPGVSVGRGICVSRDGVALRALVGKDVRVSNARGVLEILPQPLSEVPRPSVKVSGVQPAATTSAAVKRQKRIKEEVGVGKSLAAERGSKAKTIVKSGYAGQPDQKRVKKKAPAKRT